MKTLLCCICLIVCGVLAPAATRSFDGTGDYITVPLHDAYRVTGNMTLCAWVKFSTSQSNSPILARWGADQSYLFLTSAGAANKIDFATRVSEVSKNATTASTYNSGAWVFACGVFNGANILVKIGAGATEDVTGSATAGPTDNSTDAIRIGCYSNQTTGCFVGKISQISIFNRALTNLELQTVMNRGAHKLSGLVLYLPILCYSDEPNIAMAVSHLTGAVTSTTCDAGDSPPIAAYNQ